MTKSQPSQRLCHEHKFSYFDPTVSESRQIVGDYSQLCRASKASTAQPGHSDTARNTCTLTHHCYRSHCARVTTPGHLEQNHRKGTNHSC